ncbi:DISARM system helicase DrmA [Streptosporangium sp. 'caverna']|uniref:DISARM system helicase DrmA n=1 Tax=Streptosporangium sp. 'caverna' TaxID=2202249 RepID=UPI000D7DBF68|nr:DISARM system helicase DrmA [Streptosporangium sp. 'caverna']AWS44509.1 helicase [Streptosporangium sp. 'caverna']
MSTPQIPHHEQRQFRLAHEPDDQSWTARENLVDILERELLGPAGGPEEILDGVPDSAYLVGRIAPVRLTTSKDDPEDAESGEALTDVGDAIDAEESRGVPVTAVDDSTAGSDEDNVEDEPQKRGLMIPASMGLRFQVPFDLDSFTVTCTWGMYEPVKEKTEDKSNLRRYKRIPIEIPNVVKVADLDQGTTKKILLKDKVVLQIDRYDDTEGGRRLIEVALCNDRETPRKIPVEAWLYQTKVSVHADGAEVFLPVCDVLEDDRRERDDELRRLNLQYRDRLEFAIGRTCSVDWKVAAGVRRASAVWTAWLPICETPQVTAEEVGEALLSMESLATAGIEELRVGLEPIVRGYAAWLDGEQRRAEALPAHLRDEGLDAVSEARKVQKQLAEGLEHLLTDAEALRCFRFMNQVMADQRIHSQIAQGRAANPKLSIEQARAVVREVPKYAHWRTFQLAFVLMQLPLLTNPAAERRSGDLAKAQLLFFPTGGGKTEAYLGLAAYTFAIRRRQGMLDTPDGQLDGRSGIAVLMRYTLRLLTAQQFQRATVLVCAAEMERIKDPGTWGAEPFRIGLWVGTDVSPKRYDEAAAQLQKASQGHGYRLTVLQIQRCPWCGSKISARNVRGVDATRRIYVYCGDDLSGCPFAEGGEAREGLPVLTVDEEIYRLAPAFLIATVDKFARLAREGEAASLFGYVAKRCDRHGFVHPDYRHCDLKDGSKHPAKDGQPSAAVRPVPRLRPPDLIIQDELHLITGALGTTVGLFEVAIDVMMRWRTADGRAARPLLVASTATARNAPDQVRALYGRDLTIFPPQVLDSGKTFFSKEELVSEDNPGRRYIGLNTTGVRLTTAEIRVAEVLMAAGQLLMDRSGEAADPYMTLVGYFSATRELAGMARYMGDDVQTALAKGRPWSLLPRRTGTNFGALNLAELTARVASADITLTLDQMALTFNPVFDSTAGKRELRALREAGKPVPKREIPPYDALLATSMLQVGVDVTRLGLMLIVGQPKNTAEYIQASSRVGRDPERPGLVVTLGNWARPRDLAHFEQFRHYHETFYAQVEALSVTPFSVTSMERGLDGVLVSAARVLQAVQPQGLSPEDGAGRIEAQRDFASDLIDALVSRVQLAAGEDDADVARQRLLNRLDQWEKRRKHLADLRKALVYEKVFDDAKHGPLMISAENARSLADSRDAAPFIVANSMREVQPEINLLVSPIKENLIYIAPPGVAQWRFPEGD